MRRKLRIMLSAICGLICVLLIVLWARSNWWLDGGFIHFTDDGGFSAVSVKSRVFVVTVHAMNPYQSDGAYGWGLKSDAIARIYPGISDKEVARQMGLPPFPGFTFQRFQPMPNGSGFWIVVPHWFLVLIASIVAVSPWIRWSRRFSLRTLLIVTTLIAVMLGLFDLFYR